MDVLPFQAKQAQTLLRECGKGIDPFEMVVQLLPQMAGPAECCLLVEVGFTMTCRVVRTRIWCLKPTQGVSYLYSRSPSLPRLVDL